MEDPPRAEARPRPQADGTGSGTGTSTGSGTSTSKTGSGTDVDLLGIYLDDHLAGATAATERARHLAHTTGDRALADVLVPVGAEMARDRVALLGVMRALGVPVRRYEVCAGWAAEKLGRLKGNGRQVRRSPLGAVVEPEALRLGVEGKAAGWRTLRCLTPAEGRLDVRQLDSLLERAERQRDVLEEWRVRRAGRRCAAAKQA
ncbi:hypothetical protein PV343_12895 [Streptomyces sp. WI03-4A]|uniref:hypothetical protein n=1 Tax=Streptomyces sp. WI03-4A TaxID=3028706 RepID=UPI0029B9EFC1|nr:hypothetical protein [Streptomyces sp. WI03-4A]MDX2593130.1 hypothetical protein [Streptomyces sp. WI03-4A]